MTCSIKATIRALSAPKHRVSCPQQTWEGILRELHRRGEGSHESGAFLLGIVRGNRREIREAVFYDELDPRAYETGICMLDGNAFAQLWSICRAKQLTVLADAHTHPGPAYQSSSDRTNPMVARPGHIAIIVPNFACPPFNVRNLGIYEYRGEHRWTKKHGKRASQFFYTGLWS